MKRDGVQTYPETKSGYAMAKCPTAGKDLKITKCPAVRKFPRTSAKSLFLIKKITFKIIYIHGLSDCLAKGVKILDGMKFSPLFALNPFDTWKSEI